MASLTTNPLIWIGAAAAGVTAIGLGGGELLSLSRIGWGIAAFAATAAVGTAANTYLQTFPPPPSAPAADRTAFKTGNMGAVWPIGQAKRVKVEEVAAHFRLDGVEYRVSGFPNPNYDPNKPHSYENSPLLDGRVVRVSDGRIIETDAVTIRNGTISLDEATFREDVNVSVARYKSEDFAFRRVVAVEKLDKEQLKGTIYANSDKLHVATIEGEYKGTRITRRLIVKGDSDGSASIIGVFDTSNTPLVLSGRGEVAGSYYADDSQLKASLEKALLDDPDRLRRFLADAPYGLIKPGSEKPIRGLGIDQLSNLTPPVSNPNVQLPTLITSEKTRA